MDDLLHATLRQESVRERQGDTQHECVWFGLDRFGLVGLAAEGKIFFMPRHIRNLSENGKEILSMKVRGLVWIGVVWCDWQLDGCIFFAPRFTEIFQRSARR
jgi:hypothetical protein